MFSTTNKMIYESLSLQSQSATEIHLSKPLVSPPIVISEILNIFSKKNIPKYILLPQQNAITGAQSRHYDITTRVA